MVICTSRFEVYLLIDLLEKINTKPCFICIMMTAKVNYIKDAHNNGKNYFDTDIQKSFTNWTKNTKDMGKYVKHIRIAKNLIKCNLTAMVVFLKQQEI